MEKVIYSDVHGKKAEYLGSGVYRITSLAAWVQPTGDSAAIVIKKDNIDAIHAAIHADDEPEQVEACCGNCYHIGNVFDDFGDCYRYPPTNNESKVGVDQRACGEHRPKE